VRAVIWDERLKAPMGTLSTGDQFRQMSFDNYFEHLSLDWTSEVTVGPFRIQARPTIHHVPTSALLVEAAGRKLGYSSDTAFDPELIALAALPDELRARMRLIHYSDLFDTASSVIVPLREGDVLHL
jgi:hypothetical protein